MLILETTLKSSNTTEAEIDTIRSSQMTAAGQSSAWSENVENRECNLHKGDSMRYTSQGQITDALVRQGGETENTRSLRIASHNIEI